MKIVVWVTTQFQAFHRWEDAPNDVPFLRAYHRHMFHVKVGVNVGHGNRDVEFFQFKRAVELYIQQVFENKEFNYSCEQIATMIMKQFDTYVVEVSEDGENGATVFAE